MDSSVISKLKSRILFGLCKHNIILPAKNLSVESIQTIFCSSQDINVLSNTTNNIIHIVNNDIDKYFRKCKIHSDKESYVKEIIQEYFGNDTQNITRRHIENSLNSKKSLNAFFSMGDTNDTYSNVSRFYKSGNSESIGIKNSFDPNVVSELKSFVQYSWGEIYNYNLNNGVGYGNYQLFNAYRELATNAIARLLGLERMIPNSELIKLIVDDKPIVIGTLMDKAPGRIVKWDSVEKRKAMVTPALQRDLNNLHVLDVICYERDHKPSNYTVVCDKNNKAKCIYAFDNDSPLTFFLHESPAFSSYMNCSPLVKDKIINRPFLDRMLVERLLSLSGNDIKRVACEYLSKAQIYFLIKRFEGLQSAICNSIKCGCLKLLNENEWSESSVNDELNGKYGYTYLSLFSGDLHLPNQDWIRKNENEC